MVKVSFEFFPAKTEEGARNLIETVKNLSRYKPEFMSVTYGAGGSTRERSLNTLKEMCHAVSVPVAGHLTCVGASRDEVDTVARSFWEAGVKRIVALRGDPQPVEGESRCFEAHPQGYCNTVDLVAGLKKIAPFDISVAAYPEMHPEALSAEADLEHLKRKLDAGANRAITQFFFEAETFLRFRDRVLKAGITQPVIPGILPLGNVQQAWKFADMCRASVPDTLRQLFEGLDETPAIRAHVAVVVADRLCQTLRKEGVEHFHFYTLNQSVPSATLCHFLEQLL